jgi:hypothetical protein
MDKQKWNVGLVVFHIRNHEAKGNDDFFIQDNNTEVWILQALRQINAYGKEPETLNGCLFELINTKLFSLYLELHLHAKKKKKEKKRKRKKSKIEDKDITIDTTYPDHKNAL